MKFFHKVYDSWQVKQYKKYHHIYPILKKYIGKKMTLLDLGIGKGWFEQFLAKKGFMFSRIVGVDTGLDIVGQKIKEVEYVFDRVFKTDEKFDFVVCFDAFHLLKNKKIMDFVKPGGYLLVSLPLRQKDKLDVFSKEKIVEKGEIGEDEVDYFVFLKNE